MCFFSLLLFFFAINLKAEERVYEKRTGELVTEKKWGNAFVELGCGMVFSQTYYWTIYENYKEDWEYEFTWKDQAERFFSLKACRLDGNSMSLNCSHCFYGAVYHNIARTNNLSWFESLLFSIGASAYWEHVAEWREVISVNDMIFTPVGGFNLGESLFHAGNFFSSRSGAVNKVLGFLLNPVTGLKRVVYSKEWSDLYDSINRMPGRYDVSFMLGITEIHNERLVNTGFNFEFYTREDYFRKEYINVFVNGVTRSEIKSELFFSKGSVRNFRIRADTDFCSFFYQNGFFDENGFNGIALLAGLGSSLDLIIDKYLPLGRSGFPDKIAVINISGPVLDLNYKKREFFFKFRSGFFVNFSNVTSEALFKYSSLFEVRDTKSTLKNHGYYYALGTTFNTQIEIRMYFLTLRAEYRRMYFNSIEGLARNQDEIADELPSEDFYTELSFSAGILMKRTVEINLGYRKIMRKGYIRSISDERKYSQCFVQVKYKL